MVELKDYQSISESIKIPRYRVAASQLKVLLELKLLKMIYYTYLKGLTNPYGVVVHV